MSGEHGECAANTRPKPNPLTRRSCGALLALVVAFAVPARADEYVTLKSGDKVTGTLKKLDKKTLEIETAYAGTLEIDWTQVVSLQCDRPAVVWTVSGERIAGTLSATAGGQLQIQPPGGAPVAIDLANVKRIRLAGASWTGALTVAARDTEGNSSTLGALLNGELVRTTEINELKLKGIFRYGENQSAVSEANWYTLGRYRHDVAGPVFVYVSAEFMQDRFKDIDLNTILSGGLGVTILDEDWATLSSEAGLAYVRNSFRTNPDESHLAGRVGMDALVDLPLGLAFTDSLVYVPNFETTNDWQARNEAAIATEIAAGWKASIGMILEFDDKPEPGRRQDDETYYLGIGYAF